jgi:deoxycytidylate deaminase
MNIARELKEKLNKDLSSTKEYKRFFVAAATIDSNGKIIAIRLNSYMKTHPMMARYALNLDKQYKVYLHAEIAALVASNRKATDIFVARMTRDRKFAYAKPCYICEMAIREAGIKRIYYTDDEGKFAMMRIN